MAKVSPSTAGKDVVFLASKRRRLEQKSSQMRCSVSKENVMW